VAEPRGGGFADVGVEYRLRTLVEQVLGIWRGGDQPQHVAWSIPALGDWEMSCPAEEDVWVIAGNFLGDRSPDVGEAVVYNLARDVRYTYFLRTHADVLRLGLLAEQLERALVAGGWSGERVSNDDVAYLVAGAELTARREDSRRDDLG
jgi:hypothetical protein